MIPSDFTVYTMGGGAIVYIKGPNGGIIPQDLTNERYRTFIEVDTPSHLCPRVVITQTLEELQDALLHQMNSRMVQDVAIPVCTIYMAESALVTGGIITNGQRIIPAATAVTYAQYLRAIAQAYIAAKSNPTSVNWPAPPVMPF
jgi:hypothetical protein